MAKDQVEKKPDVCLNKEKSILPSLLLHGFRYKYILNLHLNICYYITGGGRANSRGR